MTKAEIKAYERHGIKTDGKNIITPDGMTIVPLLKKGNAKVGKNVYTFSTLPTNKTYIVDGIGEIMGTCPETCEGCYGTKGCYNFPGCRKSLAINTLLVYSNVHFVKECISAQLETLGDVAVRIHATGDFFNDAYAEMWKEIAKAFPGCRFWTYTKNAKYESLFDELKNANIVKSTVNGIGYNFGHIDYILSLYAHLVAVGEHPYICRCGIDDSQHCDTCTECSINKYVLFIEHSTEYKADADPLYNFVVDIINEQSGSNHEEIAEKILARI